ncbi:triose phosphate transporter [Schizosaccharomyces japonicus yFS275]|uniref:Triose phosphate transporter n=1 Tax=Schizosaccharomyces japonicus (strain yFS275 / FY16936) TaxID=402676 RepID=B6JV71_SCHJY|nr:triose phosphate transporter [Schizosaccharomyces japonicus yFS275]EEB05272.1 triose phosphate transporter [Schizosaccharomyces japonicus yFS275]
MFGFLSESKAKFRKFYWSRVGLLCLCLLWYTASAVSNTSSKSIFNISPCPVTLTFLQFGFVMMFSALFIGIRRFVFHGKSIEKPTRYVFTTTLPLSVFQIGGHVFSSLAITRIPVSVVHTVKALSPLFTVFAYRLLFHHSYPRATYVSLIPLTVGVMLACSFQLSSDIAGLTFALISTLIFVSQNIFGKKIFTEPSTKSHDRSSHRRYDKLDLLVYSSGTAFLVMVPVWLYNEGPAFLPSPHSSAYFQIWLNGFSHFCQNILAFILLGLVSPVTYSIASLIKRIAVIVVSILWFRQRTNAVQASGITLTFFGLWLYDRSKHIERVSVSQGVELDAKARAFEREALKLESYEKEVSNRSSPVDSRRSSTNVATSSDALSEAFLRPFILRPPSTNPNALVTPSAPVTPSILYKMDAAASGESSPAPYEPYTSNFSENESPRTPNNPAMAAMLAEKLGMPKPEKPWLDDAVRLSP